MLTSSLTANTALAQSQFSESAIAVIQGCTNPAISGFATLKSKNVPLISFMHTKVADIGACLDVARQHWSGPIGVYTHTGVYRDRDSKWVFDDTISPLDYASASQRWLSKGVQVIGGCCGIRAEHIEAIAKVI